MEHTVVIATAGSWGDINPFIALGRRLQARGHKVRFAIPEVFHPTLQSLGFPIYDQATRSEAELAPYLAQLYSSRSTIEPVKFMVEQEILPTLPARIAALARACKDADLLVSSALHLPASFVADKISIPWVSVALTPLTIPSSSIEPYAYAPALPARIQPYATNLSWIITKSLFRWLVDRPVNKVRGAYNLPPRSDLFFTGNLSRTLTAVAVSPTFCPRPNDWPNWIQLTGFCFWDTPLEWTEPPELTAFLNGATPVIAVSSGSLSSVSADTFTSFYRASVAAIQQIGARALVIGAPDETFSTPLPSDVYAVPFAPFSSVYPRCSAIIHHGGIGTTAQALRAGVPMLVVPWGLDQFFAGTRITQLGAGRRIDRHDLTASSVAAILRELLEGEQYRTTAQTLAAQIAQEDGVEQLCTTLEAVLAQHSSTQQVLDAP